MQYPTDILLAREEAADDPKTKYVKYGGIKFTNNVPPEEINKFVRELTPEKRSSLFEVIQILDREGLITLDEHEVSTIDKGFQALYEEGDHWLQLSHKPR